LDKSRVCVGQWRIWKFEGGGRQCIIPKSFISNTHIMNNTRSIRKRRLTERNSEADRGPPLLPSPF